MKSGAEDDAALCCSVPDPDTWAAEEVKLGEAPLDRAMLLGADERLEASDLLLLLNGAETCSRVRDTAVAVEAVESQFRDTHEGTERRSCCRRDVVRVTVEEGTEVVELSQGAVPCQRETRLACISRVVRTESDCSRSRPPVQSQKVREKQELAAEKHLL